ARDNGQRESMKPGLEPLPRAARPGREKGAKGKRCEETFRSFSTRIGPNAHAQQRPHAGESIELMNAAFRVGRLLQLVVRQSSTPRFPSAHPFSGFCSGIIPPFE